MYDRSEDEVHAYYQLKLSITTAKKEVKEYW